MAAEQDKHEGSEWTLVPYESAFSREWYIGGIGDLKFPFVISGREAVVAIAVAAFCLVLVMLGASITLVGFVAMGGMFLPRLLRDRVFDGRSLQGFLAALVTTRLRAPLILPSGKRVRGFGQEKIK